MTLGSGKSNIHTHGLFITGGGNSDDITRTVTDSTRCLGYNYTVPQESSGGTYWYHAHADGYTNPQVGGGAFGMLIIPMTTLLVHIPSCLSLDQMVLRLSSEKSMSALCSTEKLAPVSSATEFFAHLGCCGPQHLVSPPLRCFSSQRRHHHVVRLWICSSFPDQSVDRSCSDALPFPPT